MLLRILRQNVFMVPLGVGYLIGGSLILFFRLGLANTLHVSITIVWFVGAVLMFGGVGFVLLSYLRGDFAGGLPRGTEDPDELQFLYRPDELKRVDFQRLKATVEELDKKISDTQKSRLSLKELSVDERESILSTLRLQLENVLSSNVVSQIEQKYSSQIANDAQVTQIRKGIDSTSSRLRAEIGALTRRGNLNLVIGTLTTVAAVGLLGYLVLGATINYASVPNLLSHFIPRISIAVFIEVFSFFFLKLYKSSLQEIKYFQNELTNVEMQGVALETALLSMDNKRTEPIVDYLVRTDRNLAPSAGFASDSKDAMSLEPKDLANVLDKLIKLLNIGTHK